MVISMGGIGPDGHIAFNEPGSSFVKIIKKIIQRCIRAVKNKSVYILSCAHD